ncbi:MAG TPA: methyltransferase domain-containing protein [Terriglobia bacterium]|nr:methyltransferase domain-containing protein [Terriglobia bacterium]
MQDLLIKHIDLLACPKCRGHLMLQDDSGHPLICISCDSSYSCDQDIPLLFHPHDSRDRRDVTQIVREFYEENPFPNYDDFDSSASLQEKARRGVFARLLDEQIPKGAFVLEVGCGTGQLSNFLGIHWNRQVFGSDLCLNSLRIANGFRARCKIPNSGFLQMNLFNPAFQEQSFDVVICNGVLHATSDPMAGFESIGRLVKPGGKIIIGLYNTIGRLTTDFRRFLFRISGNRLRFLDGHMRNKNYNEARKRAWFMDQYEHPVESKHSIDEVLSWFDQKGFEFLVSIPKTDSAPFLPDERLFYPHDRGTWVSRLFTQLRMLLRGGSDGALFIMIGRKRQAKEETPALELSTKVT